MKCADMKIFNPENIEPDFFRKNAFFEASAGTGKTYTIQNLVCKMIESDGHDLVCGKPVSLSEILLVTFTEKATGELRNRIRKILEQRLAESLSDEKKIRIKKALNDMDQASIHTIHSFCKKIIEQFPFESGSFIRSDFISDSEAKFFIERYCRTNWPHNEIFKTILTHSDTVPSQKIQQITTQKMIEKLSEAIQKYNPDTLKFLNGHLFSVTDDPVTILDRFHHYFSQTKTKTENGEIIFELIHVFLAQELKTTYNQWNEYKKNNRKFSYNDLITTIYQQCVTGKNISLIRQLRTLYRYCIIDEFQDTNDLQWGIFKSLFLDSPSHRLFVVGDPKQSIYAFQGSNVAVYQKAIREIQKNGNAFRLVKNFRSSPSMLQAANTLFSKDWFTQESKMTFTPSEAGKPDLPGLEMNHQRLAPLLFSELETSQEKFAVECAQTILHFFKKDLQGKTYLQIPEPDLQGNIVFRNIRYCDIAILYRSRSEKEEMEKALRFAELPSFEYKSIDLFSSAETIHWAFLLQAVFYPKKQIQAALLSRFFGFSIQDAAQFDWDHSPEINRHFHHWNKLAQNKKWIQLLHSIWKETDLEQKLIAEKSFSELAKFQQIGDFILESLCSQKYNPPEKIIEDLIGLHHHEKISDQENLIAKNSDADVIQLMTIHASKGLEFPIVILFGGIAQINNKQKYVIAGSPLQPIERYLSFFKDLPLEGKRIADIEKNDTKEEWRRLFYVALTRAKHLLILPRWEDKKDTPYQCFLKNSFNEIQNYPNLFAFLSDFTTFKKKQTLENKTIDFSKRQNEEIKKLKNRFIKIYSERKNGFQIQKTSYTSLAHGNENAVVNERIDKTEEISPLEIFPPLSLPNSAEKNLPKGNLIGNVFHELFEEIDFQEWSGLNPEKIELSIKKQIEKHLMANHLKAEPDFYKPIVQVIQNTLTATLPKHWKSPETHFSLSKISAENRKAEMQFNMNALIHQEEIKVAVAGIPDWYFNGFVDLIFRIDGKWCILDWKSDSISDYSKVSIEIDMEKKHYHLQRTLYSYVLMEWLSSIYHQSTDEEKENLYQKQFGAIYYLYIRGTKSHTEYGVSSLRYENYAALKLDFKEKIIPLLKKSSGIL